MKLWRALKLSPAHLEKKLLKGLSTYNRPAIRKFTRRASVLCKLAAGNQAHQYPLFSAQFSRAACNARRKIISKLWVRVSPALSRERQILSARFVWRVSSRVQRAWRATAGNFSGQRAKNTQRHSPFARLIMAAQSSADLLSEQIGSWPTRIASWFGWARIN